MEFWEVSSRAGTFHDYCERLDVWAGGAKHVVIGLRLTLTLYKPHHLISFIFFIFFFHTLSCI